MKCKNCRNLVKRIDDDGTLYDFCGMVIDSPDSEIERDCKYYVVATHADRIRSMSDEELAKWLWFKVGKCPPFDVCPSQCIPCEARYCWQEWLQQVAE